MGARNGILIKGGEPLEVTQKVRTVVFDKTGTITEGKPRVIRVIPTVPSTTLSVTDTILLAGAAESNSEHPIGAAISTFAKEVCAFNDTFIILFYFTVFGMSTVGHSR